MKVKCTANKLKDPFYPDTQYYRLEVDKEYLVYGIENVSITNGFDQVEFWLRFDDTISLVPAELCEVVDDRFSKYWRFDYANHFVENETVKISTAFNLLPQAMIDDMYLYQDLEDQTPESRQIFFEFAELIEKEFE